jgi:adenylyltransferase/sulfurtransferase
MPKSLTDNEMETYSRQIVLADIGYDGQLKLRNAKVCLIGVGGLGSPIATQLAEMGAGNLRIVDRDIVSRSDPHRQHLYDAESVGLPKVEIAQQAQNSLYLKIVCLKKPVPEMSAGILSYPPPVESIST